MGRWRRRWVIVGALVGAVAAGGVLLGMTVVNRIETGTWEVPDTEDFVRIVLPAAPVPARTIFLERRVVELSPGRDDAPARVSSVVLSAANRPVKLPGWKGGDAKWKKVVTCVKALFAPFDVEVTDVAPTYTNYALVVVGGVPADVGVANKRVGGLAPFSGGVIPTPIVFAFSGALHNDVQAVCETVGMEVAHAYGLDHAFECKDVMTYLTGCGPKKFVDKDLPCGETEARVCEGGKPAQNSVRHLLGVLGPRPAPPPPPPKTPPRTPPRPRTTTTKPTTTKTGTSTPTTR